MLAGRLFFEAALETFAGRKTFDYYGICAERVSGCALYIYQDFESGFPYFRCLPVPYLDYRIVSY